jgi:peptide deformylase
MKLPDLDTLRIVHYPHPALKKTAEPVTEFGDHIRRLAERMLELMRQDEGVGLAAPQVGLPLRLFVSNVTEEPEGDVICVNPRFTDLSGAEEKEEGCLSFPGVAVTMRRATRAVVEAFDPAGNPFQIVGEGLQARVWQHEVDHLDGRVIIDNMSTADEIANRRAVKQLVEAFPRPRRPKRAV